MPFITTTANKILNKICKNTDFTHPTSLRVSLHTASPGESGTNEVTGGGYARQTPTLGAVASKAVSNTGVIEFANMPACTVTHVGLWDQGGTFWWWGALAASKAVAAGDTARFAVGELDIELT